MRGPAKKKKRPKHKTDPRFMAEVRGGEIVAKCTRCKGDQQPIQVFVPQVSNQTHKRRQDALDEIKKLTAMLLIAIGKAGKEGCSAGEVVGTMGKTVEEMLEHRSGHCITCRHEKKACGEDPATKKGACRAKAIELGARMKEMGCTDCGCDDAVEFAHWSKELKKKDKKGKSVSLGEYTRWASLGGPEAMEEEFTTTGRPLCSNCAFMEEDHAVFHGANPDEMEDVKPSEDIKKYKAKKKRKYKIEKQAYVNARKLEIGGCEDCTAKVVETREECVPGRLYMPHCFHFRHRWEPTKKNTVGNLVCSRTSLYGHKKSKNRKGCKAALDAEMDTEVCALKCACCAKVETDKRKAGPGL
jgi:hypothetical protein